MKHLLKEPQLDKIENLATKNNRLFIQNINKYFFGKQDQFMQMFTKDMLKYGLTEDSFSKEWQDINLYPYQMVKIFANRYSVADYLQPLLKELLPDSEEENFVKKLITRSSSFIVFKIKENLRDNLYLIHDHIKEEEHILFCDNFDFLMNNKANIFLGFVIDFDDYLYQVGFINSYDGFEWYDFEYYTSIIDPDYDIDPDLDFSMVARRHIILYLMLDEFSHDKLSLSKEHKILLGLYATSWKVEKFDYDIFKDDCIIKKEKYNIQFGIIEWNREPHNVHFFYNEKNNELILIATTEAGFDKGISLIEKLFDTDEIPRYRATVRMVETARILFNKTPTVLKYFNKVTDLFKHLTKLGDSVDSFEQLMSMGSAENLKMFLIYIKNREKNNLEYCVPKLAKEYNIPSPLSVEIIKLLLNNKKGNVNFKSSCENYKTPKKSFIKKLKNSFDKITNFQFKITEKYKNKILENLKKNSFRLSIEKKANAINNYHKYIRKQFHNNWKIKDDFMLNYSFYLLYKNGKNYYYITDYILEILKIYVQENKIKDLQRSKVIFLDYVYKFVLPIWINMGFVETEGEDFDSEEIEDFKIKASDFFYDWFSCSCDE